MQYIAWNDDRSEEVNLLKEEIQGNETVLGSQQMTSGVLPEQPVYQIYDRIFKRLFSLSSKAVVNMINGLFSTDYKPDSVVTYPGTEHIKGDLSEVFADIYVTINGVHTYHLEAQMTEDKSIIFRVFEYGYLYANRNREDNTLYFPEPKILYLYSEKDIPEYLTLQLHFPNQGVMDYKISTFDFIKTTTEELNQKKLVLLIPFQLLKLRKILEKDRSEENLKRLKILLLDDILKPIEANLKAGNIELADAEYLKDLTHKLYNHLYAHYYEMVSGGVNSMVEDMMVLDSERIIAQLTKQVTEEVTKQVTEEVTKQITEKNKEMIRLLRDGKTEVDVAEALEMDIEKVMEIAELLR